MLSMNAEQGVSLFVSMLSKGFNVGGLVTEPQRIEASSARISTNEEAKRYLLLCFKASRSWLMFAKVHAAVKQNCLCQYCKSRLVVVCKLDINVRGAMHEKLQFVEELLSQIVIQGNA